MTLAFWDIILIWAEALIRWLHVIAGIAWIGSSFYFIHLDLSLKQRASLPEQAHGDTWQVHGGGFYHMVKYLVAPKNMPDQLTWFKWEAYATWLSGFALLVVVYYLGAELYLIDKNILDLTPVMAALISIGTLILGWVIYDLLCRSPLGKNDLALGLAGFVFIVALTYGFGHIFSARGAMMQIGALIGTIMAANVLMIIIPGQRKVVASLIKGEAPDPAHGKRGKQRSLHNNYLTLPVIFVMLSNHMPLAYATKWSWVIFALIVIIGVLIRHFYNTRHQGKASPWWCWLVSALLMLCAIWLSTLGPNIEETSELSPSQNEQKTAQTSATTPPALKPVSFTDVEDVILSRCSMCHADEPVWQGVPIAPKGVKLDTPQRIQAELRNIILQTVMSNAMPPGNITEIEHAERKLLWQWYQQTNK